MAPDEAMDEVDIPCDVQQEDGTSYVWAFLDAARDPSRITEGAIVVSGDEIGSVFARVVSLTARPGGTKVHHEILSGHPFEYVDALRRAHPLSA